MAEAEVEATWRAEFGCIHETEAFNDRHAVVDAAKAGSTLPAQLAAAAY
jgi:hypothetical protein